MAAATRSIPSFVPGEAFGIVANDSTDCTVPLRNAAASGKAVMLPAGTIKIDGPIDTRNSGNREGICLMGNGLWPFNSAARTIIKQYATNEPILQLFGHGHHISDLALTYDADQGTSNTAAYAVELHRVSETVLERLYVNQAYCGIGIPQSDYLSSGDGNYMFNTAIRNVRVERYGDRALDLRGYLAGGTGNTLQNIYTNDGDGTATSPISIANWEDGNIISVHCESVTADTAMDIASSRVNVMGLHVEGFVAASGGNTKGLLYVTGSEGMVCLTGMTVLSSSFLSANVTSYYIAAISATNSHMDIRGVVERSTNTVTAGQFWLGAASGGATAEFGKAILANAVQRVNHTVTSGIAPARIYNDAFHTLYLGNGAANVKAIHMADAIPVSGTHATGHIIFYRVPTAGGFIGAVCTSGGTPGTWNEFGAISA